MSIAESAATPPWVKQWDKKAIFRGAHMEDPRLYSLAADLVVVVHFAFILFAALGGLLVIRRHWLIWIHLPVAIWAATAMLTGWICPLTPLENALRIAAGTAPYAGGFIDQYIARIIYEPGLSRTSQIAIGTAFVCFNALVYGWVLKPRSGS
jgi:hypothetical protein